jgi:hypothetical protein
MDGDETPLSSDEDVSLFLKHVITRLFSVEEYYVMMLRIVAK